MRGRRCRTRTGNASFDARVHISYVGLSPVMETWKQSGIDRTYAAADPDLVRLHMTVLLRRD